MTCDVSPVAMFSSIVVMLITDDHHITNDHHHNDVVTIAIIINGRGWFVWKAALLCDAATEILSRLPLLPLNHHHHHHRHCNHDHHNQNNHQHYHCHHHHRHHNQNHHHASDFTTLIIYLCYRITRWENRLPVSWGVWLLSSSWRLQVMMMMMMVMTMMNDFDEDEDDDNDVWLPPSSWILQVDVTQMVIVILIVLIMKINHLFHTIIIVLQFVLRVCLWGTPSGILHRRSCIQVNKFIHYTR